MVTGQAYSEDEAEYKADIAKIPQAFEKLEGALKAPVCFASIASSYFKCELSRRPSTSFWSAQMDIRPQIFFERFPGKPCSIPSQAHAKSLDNCLSP